MRKFEPWLIFFRREWNRNWPFLVGFAINGSIITKMSLGLTEEDAKISPFVQRHKHLVDRKKTKRKRGLPSEAVNVGVNSQKDLGISSR